MIGTKRVLGVATLGIAAVTLLSPVVTYAGVWWLIAFRYGIRRFFKKYKLICPFLFRVINGLLSGVIFPSMNPLLIRFLSRMKLAKPESSKSSRNIIQYNYIF